MLLRVLMLHATCEILGDAREWVLEGASEMTIQYQGMCITFVAGAFRVIWHYLATLRQCDVPSTLRIGKTALEQSSNTDKRANFMLVPLEALSRTMELRFSDLHYGSDVLPGYLY